MTTKTAVLALVLIIIYTFANNEKKDRPSPDLRDAVGAFSASQDFSTAIPEFGNSSANIQVSKALGVNKPQMAGTAKWTAIG